ncbi:MAG TPA: hypothetical protein VK983_01175 [Candidatus Limnocylindrales bacterium]|nr:hypothetical protein [Candidatus Limnocylindrales bacterium]
MVPVLALLAQTDTALSTMILATEPYDEVLVNNFPAWLAALYGGLVLLLLFALINSLLPKRITLDNTIAAVIAFFFVVGPLSQTTRAGRLKGWLNDAAGAVVQNAAWASWVVTALTFFFAWLAFWAYRSEPSLPRLIALVFFTIGLYTNDVLGGVAEFFLGPGVEVFQGFMGFMRNLGGPQYP